MEKKPMMHSEMSKATDIIDFMERLSNIDRYPMWDKIRHINVAEHTFRVAIISMMMADMNVDGGRVDFAILMRKALLHDFGEALMGDITYRVKHHSPKVEKFFDELEHSYVDEVFEKTPFYKDFAKHCKEGPEGKIVAIADMFDNIIYGAREVRMGNHTMLILVRRCIEYIVKMTRDTPYEFIGNLSISMCKEAEGYSLMSEVTASKLEVRYGSRP